MKKALASLLFVLSTSQLAEAQIQCELRMGVRKYMNWYTAGGAFVNSLYDRPQGNGIDDCTRCDRFGNKMGEFHYALVALEENRSYWLDKDHLENVPFFEGLSIIMSLYPVFTGLFNSMSALVQDPVLLAFGLQYVFPMLDERPMPQLMLTRVPVNWVAIYSAFDSLPGSDCYTLGSKAGLMVKVLTRVSIAPEDEATIPDDIITNQIDVDDEFATLLMRLL